MKEGYGRMNGKERLEKIRNFSNLPFEKRIKLTKESIEKELKESDYYTPKNVTINTKYFLEIIEQAEKKEYWMKQHRKRANELEDSYFKIQLIEKQLHQAQAKAERYKQALEFYAERDNYQWEVSYRPQQEIDCMVIDDSGHTARKALKGE